MKSFLILLLFFLYSCSAPSHPIQYSNLASSKSTKQVRELLVQQKISTSHIDTYFSFVQDINSRSASPLQDDFTAMNNETISYNRFVFQPSDTLEVNSKIATFALLQDCFSTKQTHFNDDSRLSDDISYLENTLSLKKETIELYQALFQSIPVKLNSTLGEQIKTIQNTMEQADLKYEREEHLFLIRIYLHSPLTQTRYVEHAGVLLEKYNDLVFLEKIGTYLPFQATKFSNRTQLIHYLLKREAITKQSDTALPPIILENNKVLEMRK